MDPLLHERSNEAARLSKGTLCSRIGITLLLLLSLSLGTQMSQAKKSIGAVGTKLIAGGLFLFIALSSVAQAQGPTLYMVEEDWEMVLNQPVVAINSPQVAFFMYPDAEHADCYFQVQMNYAAEEGYSSGGFHVGAFCKEVTVDEERSVVRQSLSLDGDRLEWTNAMAIFNGKLMFALKAGSGTQWGQFGGPEYLVEMDDQELHALDHYTPEKSLKSVDIGFGSNRVTSIRLRRVRLYYTDGTEKKIEVERFVKK